MNPAIKHSTIHSDKPDESWQPSRKKQRHW